MISDVLGLSGVTVDWSHAVPQNPLTVLLTSNIMEAFGETHFGIITRQDGFYGPSKDLLFAGAVAYTLVSIQRINNDLMDDIDIYIGVCDQKTTQFYFCHLSMCYSDQNIVLPDQLKTFESMQDLIVWLRERVSGFKPRENLYTILNTRDKHTKIESLPNLARKVQNPHRNSDELKPWFLLGFAQGSMHSDFGVHVVLNNHILACVDIEGSSDVVLTVNIAFPIKSRYVLNNRVQSHRLGANVDIDPKTVCVRLKEILDSIKEEL